VKYRGPRISHAIESEAIRASIEDDSVFDICHGVGEGKDGVAEHPLVDGYAMENHTAGFVGLPSQDLDKVRIGPCSVIL
jgi:hypothetical protein